VGAPSLLTWQSDVLFVLDDSRKIWRAEGNQVNDVTPDDNTIWKSTTAIAVFTQNLYVLDAASGQLWKHESPDSISFTKGTAYLATPLVPNTAASLAIDGDVWIVTTTNEIQRFRRNPLALTAGRGDFTPKWQGETVRPAAIQAVNGQTNIYVLDPAARYVVQLSRDGRELLRVALPPTLAAPPAPSRCSTTAGRSTGPHSSGRSRARGTSIRSKPSSHCSHTSSCTAGGSTCSETCSTCGSSATTSRTTWAACRSSGSTSYAERSLRSVRDSSRRPRWSARQARSRASLART